MKYEETGLALSYYTNYSAIYKAACNAAPKYW